MSKYVDGFVIVVPKGKAEEYRKMAEEGRADEECYKHISVYPTTYN